MVWLSAMADAARVAYSVAGDGEGWSSKGCMW